MSNDCSAHRGFERFLDGSQVLVDKSDLIANLATYHRCRYLLMPPHFGKSTLLDFLQELYSHGTARMTGLKIEREHLWKDKKTCKVVVLDFAEVLKHIDPAKPLREEISRAFCAHLRQQFTMAGLEPDPAQKDLDLALCSRLKNEPYFSVALLVKNNEALLEHFIFEPELFEYCSRLQYYFYGITASYSSRFRSMWVTGSVHYSESILDTLPHDDYFRDYSYNSDVPGIFGFSAEEIEQNFGPQLQHAARVLSAQNQLGKVWTAADVLEEIEAQYGGFSFNLYDNNSPKLCNPHSVLSFLAAPEQGFKTYCTDHCPQAAGLIDKFMCAAMQGYPSDSAQERAKGQSPGLDGLIPEKQTWDFSFLCLHACYIDGQPFLPTSQLLWRQGFFSIKQVNSSEDDNDFVVDLAVPNLEVRRCFEASYRRLKAAGQLSGDRAKTENTAAKPGY